MQIVSDAYKEEIEKNIRNRGHIRVSIGVINQTAQDNANVTENSDLTYFSEPKADSIFMSSASIRDYATDEEDFTKVDGTMYFLPKEDAGIEFYKCGIITNDMKGAIYIAFEGVGHLDIKGLTIDFGESHPTYFRVQTNNTIHEYGCDDRFFGTDDPYDDTSFIIITPLMMKITNTRLRIYSISLGISNTFTDSDVLDFTSKEYVSPVTDSIPSRDMVIKINNRNQYYNPDNPESAIAYMEVGQRVTVQFGYDLDEVGLQTEWVSEIVSHLTEWGATDSDATFTATDMFYSLTGTYYKGLYRPEGISLYDLAVDVLADAGVTKYHIDSYLHDIIVYNPMPPVNHAAALQIIANAGRCVLYEDRGGSVYLESSFMPDINVSTNGETEYSHAMNIATSGDKPAYGIDSNNFTPVDGSVYFMAGEEDYKETGYISHSLFLARAVELGQPLPSGAANVILMRTDGGEEIVGTWTDGTPSVILSLEAVYSSYGLKIQFREQAARKFRIQTYNDSIPVDDYTYENEDIVFSTDDAFLGFNSMVITILVGYANARVTIDSVILGEKTDYVIRRKKMTATPEATRQRDVKSIKVARDVYTTSSEEKEISKETITVSPDDPTYYIYMSDPGYDFTAISNTNGVTAEVTESSSYYAKITFTGVTHEMDVEYVLKGYKYTITETFVTKEYNFDGEEIAWANPLISNDALAIELADWLSSYYLGDVQYNVTWMGDPRLDANDLMYLELKDRETTMIRAYQNELSYNGSWRNSIQARKVVY